ncbi:hypothetical protein EVA_11137 [gut metagenome]|uniref:EF-hand domain-containing protein n=1 Tax=gut metagenome TaxID=749906 RepID=J9G1N6_9ZZZZ
MLAIPAIVLRDQYAKLMKKEVDGKGRVERFCEMCLTVFDQFEQGQITVEELKTTLKQDAGIEFKK